MGDLSNATSCEMIQIDNDESMNKGRSALGKDDNSSAPLVKQDSLKSPDAETDKKNNDANSHIDDKIEDAIDELNDTIEVKARNKRIAEKNKPQSSDLTKTPEIPVLTGELVSMSGTRGRKRTKTQDAKTVNNIKKKKVLPVSHVVATVESGSVLTFGEGDTGQLGLGPDIMDRTKPGKVKIDDEVTQIVCGGMHTVCLTVKHEVYTFGCNDEGALGRHTADEDDMFVPGKVELDDKIIHISAGDSHTAALGESGRVFIWGTFRDASGSIGLLPDGSKCKTPVLFMTEPRVVKICSGTDHIVCLTEDGQIFSAGCAEQGQLGRVAECFSQRGGRKGLSLLLTPGTIHCRRRSVRFDNIWTGQYHTFAKATNGDIYSWGLNNYFQLGISDMQNRFVPELCPSFTTAKSWQEIAGGQHHTIALDKDGKVYSLGRKEYGRLGLGEENLEEKSAPTLIPSLKDKTCVHVSCGTAVSYAVTDQGEVYAWGMGSSKQLGQTEEDDLYEPTIITGKQLETRLALTACAGGQHAVILAKDKS